MKLLSCVRLFVTPRTVAWQVPLFMGFSRQEYWSGLPFPSPGDPPDPGIKPGSPELQADSLPSEPPGNSYHINLGVDMRVNIITKIINVSRNKANKKELYKSLIGASLVAQW